MKYTVWSTLTGTPLTHIEADSPQAARDALCRAVYEQGRASALEDVRYVRENFIYVAETSVVSGRKRDQESEAA